MSSAERESILHSKISLRSKSLAIVTESNVNICVQLSFVNTKSGNLIPTIHHCIDQTISSSYLNRMFRTSLHLRVRTSSSVLDGMS